MTLPWDVDLPLVSSVFHPSDFTEASERAFAHALAVALIRQTELTILHAARGELEEEDWQRYPAVRRTLERWGLLEPGSSRSAVLEELSIRVRKVAVRGRDPFEAALEFVREEEPDLIVLATGGRSGLPRWVRPSRAERIARRSRTMTLFGPEAARGFVDPATGATSLRRILVPVDQSPNPGEALLRATRIAEAIGERPVCIRTLHVGQGAAVPALPPNGEAWDFEAALRNGDVVEEILAEVRKFHADQLVLTTEGRQGVLDALRGSVTERVLRGLACPLLAIPAR